MQIVEMKLQAKEVTKIIVGSGFSNHYFTEKNGVVYICDKEDFKKSVESGEYNAIGSINTDNKAYREVTRELLALFKSYSRKKNNNPYLNVILKGGMVEYGDRYYLYDKDAECFYYTDFDVRNKWKTSKMTIDEFLNIDWNIV